MNLQQALNESEYSTATTEYNGLQTTVDGSGDGYSISTGEQNMPTRDYRHVETVDEAVQVIEEMKLDANDWEPVGEAEA